MAADHVFKPGLLLLLLLLLILLLLTTATTTRTTTRPKNTPQNALKKGQVDHKPPLPKVAVYDLPVVFFFAKKVDHKLFLSKRFYLQNRRGISLNVFGPFSFFLGFWSFGGFKDMISFILAKSPYFCRMEKKVDHILKLCRSHL